MQCRRKTSSSFTAVTKTSVVWILPGSGMGPLDETGKRHMKEAITLAASGEKGATHRVIFLGNAES